MGNGMLHLLGGGALFAADGPRFGIHTPHALKVCIALLGGFRVRPEGEPWTTCDAALIAADVPHELDATGALLCILAAGPETADGRRLALLASAAVTPLCPARTAAMLPRLRAFCEQGSSAEETRRSIVAAYASPFAPRPTDPRILTALRLIRASPGLRVPVREISAAVSLSPSRLIHLFREQTNLSIKRYSLWLRVVAALEAMPAGGSLTEIAYQVGFADPAHLSRAFRRMIGINPSELLQQTRVRRSIPETASAFITTAVPFKAFR
jgi:AraC family transcriptional regulator